MDHRAEHRARPALRPPSLAEALRALRRRPGDGAQRAPAALARARRHRLDGARAARAELRVVRGAALLHRPAHPPPPGRARPRHSAHGLRGRRTTAACRRLRPKPAAGAARRRRAGHRRLRPHGAPGRTPAPPDRRPDPHPARTRRHRAARGHPRRAAAAVHGDPRHGGAGPVQPADAASGGGPHLGRRPVGRPPPCPGGDGDRRPRAGGGAAHGARPGAARVRRRRTAGRRAAGAGRARFRRGGGRGRVRPYGAGRTVPPGGCGRTAARPGAVRAAADRAGRAGQRTGARGRDHRRADPQLPGRPGRPGHRRRRAGLRARRHPGAGARPGPGARPARDAGPRTAAGRHTHRRIRPRRGHGTVRGDPPGEPA